MRRWFRKTGENTIELKEKRWGGIKIILGIILLIGIYYNFIDPRYKDDTWRYIKITYQPDKWAEEQFEEEVSETDPNLTRWGETKEEFISERKEFRLERGGGYLVYLYFYWCLYSFYSLLPLAHQTPCTI